MLAGNMTMHGYNAISVGSNRPSLSEPERKDVPAIVLESRQNTKERQGKGMILSFLPVVYLCFCNP